MQRSPDRIAGDRRISAPWHSAIGFGTKLPTRSGNSEYPQNTCTPGRLVREVRLMGQHNGQQPIRVLERHQSAGARLISAELSHPIEKCGVLQRNGKRLPTGLRDATVKGRGIANLRLALRQLFPESPAATLCLGQL